MVKVKEDLTGKIFGRLTVLEQAEDYISPSGTHYAQWLCECSCENHTKCIVRGTSLRNKDTTSCGCIAKENSSKRLSKYNNYDIDDDVVIGHSLNTDDLFYVDLKNYEKIKDIGWDVILDKNKMKRLVGYDKTTKKMILMHQLLGFYGYDHKDRNELNNLESNLRPCTISQNGMNRNVQKHNTSGYSGVSWDKDKNKWRVRINIDKKETTVGFFTNKEDAIKARLQAESEFYGEFAPQRHLFEQYGINQNGGEK